MTAKVVWILVASVAIVLGMFIFGRVVDKGDDSEG